MDQAVAAFVEVIGLAQEDEHIEDDAARDLIKEAEEVAQKAAEGETDKAAEKIEELRAKLDERTRAERVDPGLAQRLHAQIDDIERALGQ